MTEAQDRPLVGILWMVLTGILFVGVAASVKTGAQDLPAAQAAFLRYALGIVFLLPMLRALRGARLTARTWAQFLLRAVFHTIGVILWFYAMTRIPLAEVAALNYLSPIYITILATLVLGERFVPARGYAIAASAVGTLLLLRPGFREIDDGHLAMLGTALCFAGSYLVAKALSDRVPSAMVVVMMSLGVTIGLAPVAIAVWQTPTLAQIGWLTLTAALATGAHYAMTLAFKSAPISATQPVTFLQLLWATILGAVLFGERVDGLTLLGGAVIAGAAVALSFVEARGQRRRERTALGPD